jgi:hypothetical protein
MLRVGTAIEYGDATVNGGSTVKYEATDRNRDIRQSCRCSQVAVCRELARENNRGELRNLQEGSQPANLFEIETLAGCHKTEMLSGTMQFSRLDRSSARGRNRTIERIERD